MSNGASRGPYVEEEFAAVAESVASARALVRLALGDDAAVDDVEVVVSELATNAVLHAATWYRLRIERLDGVVRVEVTDSGIGLPVMRHLDPTTPSGRGLLIVDSITQAWGVTLHATGKTVWADIRG